MRQQARLFAIMVAAVFPCGGCAAVVGASIATSMATSTATHIAMDRGFGEDKLKRDARAAYERAPPCASMTHGVQNGRVVTVVNDITWSDAPKSGERRVIVDYQIDNRSSGAVLVTPRRLTVSDATGKLTNALEATDSRPTDRLQRDDTTVLPAGVSAPLVSVFDVPPGEYALMVPNGRTEADPEPTWVDGCRFSGPAPTTAQR